jgi:MFS family permease
MFGNFFLFGSYYCYDLPSSLQIQFTSVEDNGLGLSDEKYNLLYAVYSFPNIVLPLVGGIICDYIGVKPSLMIFTTLVTIG